MSEVTTYNEPTETKQPQWRPLTAKQRRVLGTLMEKSKSTPDAYPMTLGSLTTGCNQKTNRSPLTNLTTDQVEKLVEELRLMGALGVLQGTGRVEKIRHYGYQWLEISKVEAAVMTELLLRGEQTVGELRGRAARMEPIADVQELESILKPLIERRLVNELSPTGRGQIISHNLYEEWELKQLRTTIEQQGSLLASDSNSPSPAMTTNRAVSSMSITALEQQVVALSGTVEQLSNRLAKLEQELGVSN